MNRLFWFGLFMLLLAPSRAKAQSPFDGFWLRDLTRAQLPKKSTTSMLQNGVLHCEICRPPLDVKVDGQDHLIPSGDACRNTALVEVLDDRTVEVSYMENGRVTGIKKVLVSPNGARLALQTWKREGNVIEIDRMTVDPAGQLMIILSADPQRGTTERLMAKKFKLTL
jgi:hypothetical protein